MRSIRVVLGCLIAVSVVLPASVLFAQIGAPGDLKEIQEYRLTVPALKQVMAATRNLIVAMNSDPRYQRIRKLEAELKQLEEKDQPSEAETKRIEKIVAEMESIRASTNIMGTDRSLSEIEATVAKEPLVANALKAAGISAREYAKFMAAFIQASMIQSLQKQGAIKGPLQDVNPENVKFAEEHQAEFETFVRDLESLEKEP